MTTRLILEHGERKKEGEVRQHIDQTTAVIKANAERRGEHVSAEKVREEVAKLAERDRQKGKI